MRALELNPGSCVVALLALVAVVLSASEIVWGRPLASPLWKLRRTRWLVVSLVLPTMALAWAHNLVVWWGSKATP